MAWRLCPTSNGTRRQLAPGPRAEGRLRWSCGVEPRPPHLEVDARLALAPYRRCRGGYLEARQPCRWLRRLNGRLLQDLGHSGNSAEARPSKLDTFERLGGICARGQ